MRYMRVGKDHGVVNPYLLVALSFPHFPLDLNNSTTFLLAFCREKKRRESKMESYTRKAPGFSSTPTTQMIPLGKDLPLSKMTLIGWPSIQENKVSLGHRDVHCNTGYV